MQNTWSDRDLPVLDAIVKYLDDAAGSAWPYLSDIAEATDLELKEVTKAAYALEH